MGDGRTQNHREFSCFINHIAFQLIQYFMNNCVETKERRAFILLRQLRAVCDAAVTLHSRKFNSVLMCLPGLDKDVCHSHPDERTSISTIRASLESSEASAFVFSAKFERAEGVCSAKHVGHTNILCKSLLQPAAMWPQPEL